MSIKKIVVAAGLVLGVVGGAWAQSSPITTPDKFWDGDNTINITYSVELFGTLRVVPDPSFNVKDTNFLNSDIDGISAVPTTTIKAARLGLVQANTNYANWDVIVSAQNGGTLRSGSDPGVCTKDEFGVETCVGKVDGSALKDEDGDDVTLSLAIVSTATGTAGGTGGLSRANAIAKVANLTNDVSFAAALAAGTPAAYGTTIEGTGQALTDLLTDGGFTAPISVPTLGYVEHGLTFEIFGGLELGAGKRISGNDEGDYEEVLSFTLVAAF